MKISFENEDKTGQQCPFSRKYQGLFFEVFHGLLLFGRLLIFIFDKIPRAMLIWGATTIWQVRVPTFMVAALSKYIPNDL